MRISERSPRLTLSLLATVAMFPFAAGARDLEDAITDLYTEDGEPGITLSNIFHEAHFTPTGLAELAQLQDAIGTSLVAFAPSAPVSSFTFDLEQGVFTRSTQTFGPLVAERAPTIGRLKLNIGASYTDAIYSRFEGEDLDTIEIRFAHTDCCDTTGAPVPGGDGQLTGFELDQVGVNIDLEIEQRVAAFRATLGLTDHWDFGLLIPYVWNRLEAESVGFVINNGGGNAHQFNPAVQGDSPFSSSGGHAEGIGDIVARTKYHFVDTAEMSSPSPYMPDVSFLFQTRFGSGNEDDLLGAGEYGFLPMFVLSREIGGTVEPHLNLGYEFTTDGSENNNLLWVVGAALRATDHVTFPIDLVGRHELDGDDVGDNLVDLALGIKVNPISTALLVANVRVPLNGDEGLRADYIWSLGVEVTVP
jgi:Putative MetA-pathway of phenol degradation